MITEASKASLIKEIRSFYELLIRYSDESVERNNVVSYLFHASCLDFENKYYERGFQILSNISMDEISGIENAELAETIKQYLVSFLIITTATPWNDENFKYLMHTYVTITNIWLYNRVQTAKE